MRIRAKYQQSSLDLIVFCFFPVPFLFYIVLFVFFFFFCNYDERLFCEMCEQKRSAAAVHVYISQFFFSVSVIVVLMVIWTTIPYSILFLLFFFSPFRFAHTKQNQRNRNIKMPCDFCIWMIFVWSVFLCDFLIFLTSWWRYSHFPFIEFISN